MTANRDSALAALIGEAYRLRLLGGLEERLSIYGYSCIAGVDEVGRGCLAGPVMAAAVIPDPSCLVPGVDDSKHLSPVQRERLADVIRANSLASAVAPVSASDIDRSNILEATRQAMRRALGDLETAPELVLIDAVRLADLQWPQLSIIRGDSISYAVACASILAKVARDRLMVELDREYPQYGFASNKGYGAAGHLEALAQYGPCPEHRLTFRSVVPRKEMAL